MQVVIPQLHNTVLHPKAVSAATASAMNAARHVPDGGTALTASAAVTAAVTSAATMTAAPTDAGREAVVFEAGSEGSDAVTDTDRSAGARGDSVATAADASTGGVNQDGVTVAAAADTFDDALRYGSSAAASGDNELADTHHCLFFNRVRFLFQK